LTHGYAHACATRAINTQLSAVELGEDFTVGFKQNRTYSNFDGEKLHTGRWKWSGSDIVLDNGKQVLTIVSLGQGFMTWKFAEGGNTFMYTFKSTSGA